MNPFSGWRLIRAYRDVTHKEVDGYGQKRNNVPRSTAGAGRALPSLRRAHGVGAGARTRFVRLALRQLRRAGRPGDCRPSAAERRGTGARAHRYPPETVLSQLTLRACRNRGAVSLPVQADPAVPPPSSQQTQQNATIGRIEPVPQGTGLSCGGCARTRMKEVADV